MLPATDPDADSLHQSRQPPRRRFLYFSITTIVTLVLLLSLAEGISQVVLGRLYGWQRTPRREQDRTHDYDALLGWKPKAGRQLLDRFGKNPPATINTQGFRATRDYTPAVPWGRYRIVCLGDSYTYGQYVGDDDTFPAQLEALAPTIEAVNMGRPGYGLDQLYLWYKRDGVFLQTDLLLVAFIAYDLLRMTSDTYHTSPKPQLFLQGNTLVLSNVPVPTWGGVSTTSWLEEFPQRTALFQVLYKAQQRLFSHYEMFPVVARIFDDLQELSRARQQHLVLVYLPTLTDLQGSGRLPQGIAQRVEHLAREKQILFWNLTSMFQELSASDLMSHFLPDGHYSARGNRLVATTLLRALREQFPDVLW